jgi:hypothetical protein
MKIARFVGDSVLGVWTYGRLYDIIEVFDEKNGYSLKGALVNTDNEKRREVPVESFEDFFDKQSAWPAVVLRSFSQHEAGDVVMLVEVSDDGNFFRVGDEGFRSKNVFELLGALSLVEGNMLCSPNGHWVRVGSIDWRNLSVECDGEWIPLVRCRFPVGDGDICVEPVLTCIRPEPGKLTQDRPYTPRFEKAGWVIVDSDDGQSIKVRRDRFK